MKNVIIIGAGGHAKSCSDVIQSKKEFSILGFIDNNLKKNSNLKIIGSDKELQILRKKTKYALIGIGQIKNYKLRKNIYDKLINLKFDLPSISSKFAYVAKDTQIDISSIIMHRAIVNSNAQIGYNTIINTGAIVEHDTIVQNNCHIAPGAILNGEVLVKSGTFVGSGTIIKQGIKIGHNCIISANKYIDKSIPDGKIIK